MPDPPGQPDAQQQLGADIRAEWPNARELSAGELATRFPGRKLLAGWYLPAAIAEAPHDLLIAIDHDFPWSLPVIALPDPPDGITYPHIEADGRLCLTQVSAAYTVPVGVDHVRFLLQDADSLLYAGRTKANEADFFAEAQSYWTLVAPTNAQYWLLAAAPRTHAVWMSGRDGANIAIAPTKEVLQDWSRNGARQLDAVDVALMLKLETPLRPDQYPLRMADLVAVAAQVGADAEFDMVMRRWKARHLLPVVLSFEFREQTVSLGGAFIPPSQVRMPGAHRHGIPGFRQGAALRGRTRAIALSTVPLRFPHAKVVPIFRSFLNERTTGHSARALSQLHVTVAGCGAVGGQLAVQLAQAGVGHLTLLDNDTFDWRNVGRHVLDGNYVGQNKAVAVAEAIRRRFPDIEVTGLATAWESYRRNKADDFVKADLVVSATAEAASNLHLDRLVELGEVPPALFCWLEAFGVAAHAILCIPDSGRLRDVCTPMGVLLEPVIDLDKMPAAPQEPACGAIYQPFSSLAALSGVALAGELAIDAMLGRVAMSQHRIWVGSAAEISANGLSLTSTWQPVLNAMGFSRRFDVPMLAMQN